MIKTNLIPTQEYYRRILAEPDADARRALYIELLMQPWQQMMSMMRFPGMPEQPDELNGARVWGWVLPDQTDLVQTLLAKLEDADAWTRAKEAMDLAARRMAPYSDRLPFDEVTGWLILADPAHSNPLERGYTGATDWFNPRFIGQFWEPDEVNMAKLPGLVVHEMHHLMRLRVFPWDMSRTSVADYIVHEGMAESFASALFGEQIVGTYVTDVDAEQVEQARRLIGDGLTRTGFNAIRSYIFGDALAERSGYEPLGGMPTYGGYAVGYYTVQAYLKRTGRSIEEATFIPADEIVGESGYFA